MDENQPLTHGRNLTEFLDQYGIVTPSRAEALELERGIKMEALVDDARHLVRPLTVPAGIYYANAGAAIGLYSGVQITSNSANGIYLAWLNPRVLSYASNTGGAAGIVVVATVPPAVIPTDRGGEMETIVETITMTGWDTNRTRLLNSIDWNACPLWLPPGNQLRIQLITLNTALPVDFMIQEIP